MSEHDAHLQERLESVEKLAGVVGLIRAMAAAREQQGRRQLQGVMAYAEIVAEAMSEALNLVPPDWREPELPPERRPACVILMAEQGFVGGFNARLLEAAAPWLRDSATYAIGTRGIRLLQAQGIEPQWTSPMAVQVEQAHRLAHRLGGHLVEALAGGRIGRIELIFTMLEGARLEICKQSVIPLDTARFRRSPQTRPLTDLPAPILLRKLADEYLHAQLAAAVLESHAAENHARLEAMSAAHSNISRHLEQLHRAHNIQRQNRITDELLELAASALT